MAPDVPPQAFFLISALFHYLGPAFAVLLFAQISVLGVAWLRIATAAALFALWRRPWRRIDSWTHSDRRALCALGIVLGLMNVSFYLAIARLPLATVGAIEFLGPIVIAAFGARSRRNSLALLFALGGVAILSDIQLRNEPAGLVFALLNCALFALYILLGYGVAQGAGSPVDRLGAAMLIALVVATPFGLVAAIPALLRADLLFAGIGVGVCSSMIPYLCDQLAMARLPRATFALMLALLPAIATLTGFIVLRQRPQALELIGITLIIVGVGLHRSRPPRAAETYTGFRPEP